MEDMYVVNELEETLRRYGIEISSPKRVFESMYGYARHGPIAFPKDDRVSVDLRQHIQNSDCVLIIVGRGVGRSINTEVKLASLYGKLLIPIVEEGAEIPRSLAHRECIVVDKNQPRLSYERAAQYLNKLKIEKERRNSIGGLLLLGIGVLLLAALVSD